MLRKLVLPFLFAALAASCVSTPKEGIARYPGRHRDSVYVVQRGESLGDVAKKFGIGAAELKKANRLSTNNVNEGQRLVIPDGRSSDFMEERKAATPKKRVRPLPDGKAPRIDTQLLWPITGGAVSSDFGIRGSGKHDGIDITAAEGTPIVAAADGTIIFSGWGPSGYGNIVVIRHSESLVTVYAHNKDNFVERGQAVKQGEKIATVGNSGRATTMHCHFELRVNRIPYDPLPYLEKR